MLTEVTGEQRKSYAEQGFLVCAENRVAYRDYRIATTDQRGRGNGRIVIHRHDRLRGVAAGLVGGAGFGRHRSGRGG